MKPRIYEIRVASHLEGATVNFSVAAQNFGDAMRKSVAAKKKAGLPGIKRVVGITEIINRLD